jgi:cell division protein ZapA
VSQNFVNVTIGGRQYRMACEVGQEMRLTQLANELEALVERLRGRFGEVGDQRLIVMAALTLADELFDLKQKLRGLEADVAEMQDARATYVERSKVTQEAVAAALNAASERIEKMTQVLNRPLNGGIALG